MERGGEIEEGGGGEGKEEKIAMYKRGGDGSGWSEKSRWQRGIRQRRQKVIKSEKLVMGLYISNLLYFHLLEFSGLLYLVPLPCRFHSFRGKNSTGKSEERCFHFSIPLPNIHE